MTESLRILAVAELRQGSNAYAYIRAFRRLGHSVSVVPSEAYVPTYWKNKSLRGVRKLLQPFVAREYTAALISEAQVFQPHLFFVFKGSFVEAQAVRAVRETGAIAINFYPDVSFRAHGPYIPQALPEYDWVFTTKTFGLRDMAEQLSIRAASFLAHSFDPETHRPVALSADEHARHDCDVSFIGTWSPKKQRLLEHLKEKLPALKLRIWGAAWKPSKILSDSIMWQERQGLEYAKALVASRINLAILSEARSGASSGDLITSRTFHIPATGAFMLHERTDELLAHFVEGQECGCFASPAEMVEKVTYYLAHDAERRRLAEAGYRRSLASGYVVDERARQVLEKYEELRDSR